MGLVRVCWHLLAHWAYSKDPVNDRFQALVAEGSALFWAAVKEGT